MKRSHRHSRHICNIARPLSFERLEERTVLSAASLVETLQSGQFAPRDEVIGKIGFELASIAGQFLLRQNQANAESGLDLPSDLTSMAVTDFTSIQHAGNIVVDAIASNSPDELANDLLQLGMTGIAVAGRLVSGVLPLDSIPALQFLPSLASVRASHSFSDVGATTTQGDHVQR